MKFVKLGNWFVRADRVEAVKIFRAMSQVVIHTIENKEYSMFFNSPEQAKRAHEELMESLEKFKIGD